MTKSDKLYQQLVTSTSRSISFRDFERLLRAFGFELDRTVGSLARSRAKSSRGK